MSTKLNFHHELNDVLIPLSDFDLSNITVFYSQIGQASFPRNLGQFKPNQALSKSLKTIVSSLYLQLYNPALNKTFYIPWLKLVDT